MVKKTKTSPDNVAKGHYRHLENNPRAVRYLSSQVVKWLRERIAAAGGDPADVPDMPFQMLNLRAVRQMTGLGTTTLYRMQREGEFPRAIPVDRASARVSQ